METSLGLLKKGNGDPNHATIKTQDMKQEKFTEKTYCFTAGFKLWHLHKDFPKRSEAIKFAELLKKTSNIKQKICVERYAFTECGQVYWESIAYV